MIYNSIKSISIHLSVVLMISAIAIPLCAQTDKTASSLCMVPYPKQVKMKTGKFTFSKATVITANAYVEKNKFISDLKNELIAIRSIKCEISKDSKQDQLSLIISVPEKRKTLVSKVSFPKEFGSIKDAYILDISVDGIIMKATSRASFMYGIQAIKQLIRANMTGRSMSCMTIIDWPSLAYRGFSDDITRGSSPTLSTLKKEIILSSYFKMNFFTYYLEHQYKYSKHPLIGPAGGSLLPMELSNLVKYADDYEVEVIGCQQSFGHFAEILKYDQYKDLRENSYILNPLKEDSYKLLDDMYADQALLLKSKFFNICCDETVGLGQGATKPEADKIGVGAIYSGHIKRVHDILKNKYGKRIMMWGDIIINHPENLKDIPKDTVMLSWGYEPLPSFEQYIQPFKQSGYDFFVCPGISCWSRILPDFNKSVVNIQNYVRDGAKMGAMGMLNTTWDDDGENLTGCNWYGIAWGSECAWNASKTDVNDFNRRIGAVLFGESGDNFGRAIELLSKNHQMPGYMLMMDERFWTMDDGDLPVNTKSARHQANELKNITEKALGYLRLTAKDAKVNKDILDCYIFGADRMLEIAKRQINFLDAAKIYEFAYQSLDDKEKVSALLSRSIDTIRSIRDSHSSLKDRYKVLWDKEYRLYAHDRIAARYDTLLSKYDKIISRLIKASRDFNSGNPLPSPAEIGLAITEKGVRSSKVLKSTVKTDVYNNIPWANKAFSRRICITVNSNGLVNSDKPVEADLRIGSDIPNIYQLYEQTIDSAKQIPCQVSVVDNENKLFFIDKADTDSTNDSLYMLYYMPDSSIADIELSAGTSLKPDGEDKIVLENEYIRLLIGSEGSHIYGWEIKALDNLDITSPGESDWAGFADNYSPYRNMPNKMEIVANGRVLSRIKCSDSTGMEKTFSLWAGFPFVEVTYNTPINMFACYDNINIMGAMSANAGSVLFSDGYTDKVKQDGEASISQIARNEVNWSAKYQSNGVLLGLITPEAKLKHIVGPGGGMGGLMIEGGSSNAHFVIYGGVAPVSVKNTLDELASVLDFTKQPKIEFSDIMIRE